MNSRPLLQANCWRFGLALLLWVGFFASSPARQSSSKLSAEEKGIRYLTREVPRWRPQNGCFSCHNNGDGARILFAARRHGYPIPEAALKDTVEWLSRPLEWDENKGESGFSDKRLARIQFAASLVEAARAKAISNQKPLRDAARSLLDHQAPDGSWPIDATEQVGSPVTYGVPLATLMALRTLEAGDPVTFGEEIRRARDWLQALEPRSLPDAAAVLLSLAEDQSVESSSRGQKAMTLIMQSQKQDGGWGPYRFSPSEVFDTALALIVLSQVPGLSEEQLQALKGGRAYLESAQLDSGGWIETTRPAGANSYAQHVSTSAWATQALIETRQFVPD